MLSVEQALSEIVRCVQPFVPTRLPLAEALGLVLAESITSDTDSPPFDKSLMDGFAVRAEDVAGSGVTLRVVEEVTAGRVPEKHLGRGEAARIMTGAPLPEGADAVVRSEQAEFDAEAGLVRVVSERVVPGANLMRRGTTKKAGEGVLPKGRVLRPQELGALAEMGRATVLVRRRPRVAVLATGDELVPIDHAPGPGQIRNSNETMLAAQIVRAGGVPIPLGIARDERTHLREKIDEGLESDVLLLSGGVSAGKLDLVPSELQAAGVSEVFHKVRLKPGKPLWYGVLDGANNSSEGGNPARRHVFGLPGNPVSSLVCFELFVRTALRRLMGVEEARPRPVRARLEREHIARGGRPTYHPALFEHRETGPVVRLVRWQGSADLQATVDANAMALFPAGEATYGPGELVDVIPWD